MLKEAIFALLTGYFLGCIPTAWIIGTVKGVDLSKVGSGNLGATNAGRILGRNSGILVLIIDTFKGSLACLLWISKGQDLMVLAGVSAIIGHIFSLPTLMLIGRLRAGRGVATALGVTIVIYPPFISVICLLLFLVIFSIHKILPIDILLTVLVGLILTLFSFGIGRASSSQVYFSAIVATVLLLTHLNYVDRYLHGTLEYSMTKGSESGDVDKVKKVIRQLKISDGSTFGEFIANVKLMVEQDIEFSKCEMPIGITGSLLMGEKIYILYDANVSPLHQLQIKLHELGHVVLGHAVGREVDSDNELIGSILRTQHVYDELLQGHLKREKYNDAEEREAEIFATEILGRLRLELDFNNDPLVRIGLG